jgi:hypothetical protein
MCHGAGEQAQIKQSASAMRELLGTTDVYYARGVGLVGSSIKGGLLGAFGGGDVPLRGCTG